MLFSRAGSVNTGLLVLAIAGVLFGIAGFFLGGAAGAQSNNSLIIESNKSSNDPMSDFYDDDDYDGDYSGNYTPSDRDDDDTAGSSNRKPTTKRRPKALPRVKSRPTDGGNAKINGRVLDKNGKPVAGAKIVAQRAGTSMTPPQLIGGDVEKYREDMARYFAETLSQVRNATTDRYGNFSFKGLDPSLAYNFTVNHPDLGTGYSYNVGAGDTIDVVIASSKVMLSGKVRTEDGMIPESFTVTATSATNYGSQTKSFETNDGSFELNVYTAGKWMVSAKADGYYQESALSVDVNEDSTPAELTLKEGATLRGEILSTAGVVLSSASITLTPKKGSSSNNASSSRGSGMNSSYRELQELRSSIVEVGEDISGGWGGRGFYGGQQSSRVSSSAVDSLGRYSFKSLAPGDYTAKITFGSKSKTEDISVSVGKNEHNFKLDSGALLKLKLVNTDGNPVALQSITAYSVAPSDSKSSRKSRRKNGNWVSLALVKGTVGEYTYSGFDPGEYKVTVNPNGYTPVVKTITIVSGENSETFEAKAACYLSGTITMIDTAVKTQLYIRLRVDDGTNGSSNQGYTNVNQNNGIYRLGPLEPGLMLLEVAVYNNGYKVTHSSTIDLQAGENTYDAEVDGGNSLRITVYDDQGQPVKGIYLKVKDPKGSTQNSYTNSEGIATLSNLEQGTYTVTPNNYSRNGLMGKTTDVFVGQGSNDLTVNLQKSNCTRITSITPKSQADKAGLKVGDLIFEYNGEQINSINDLLVARQKTTVNDSVTVVAERNGSVMTFYMQGGMIGINGQGDLR